MRRVLVGFLVFTLISLGFSACGSSDDLESRLNEEKTEIETFREFRKVGPGFYSITSQEISQFIWFLAGPYTQGRRNGTSGNMVAGSFLMDELKTYSLDSVFSQEFEYGKIKNPRHSAITDAGWSLFGPSFEVMRDGRNIIGILTGTDKKDEFIVVSAHYDHLGANKKGQVFPGADDNASGTAAVLEIAEAFTILAREEGIKPRRSVIFAFFDAEEMGLWGSQYFVENPPVPFGNIVAVINLDMIGRNNPNELYITTQGKRLHLFRATNRANIVLGFELITDSSFLDRSDQDSFSRASQGTLPVILYISGPHDDYHTSGDTADKINFKKARDVARLAFFAAWLVSNQEEKPIY